MAGAGIPGPVLPRRGPEDPVARVERQALEALLQRPMDLVGSGFEDLDGSSFTVPAHRAVHDAIRAAGGLDAFVEILARAEAHIGVGEESVRQATRVFDEAVRDNAGEVVGAVVTELAVAPLPQDKEGGMRAYARGVVAALVRMDLTRRTGEARAALQRMDPDDEGYQEAFAGLVKLEERRRAVSEVQQ